MFSRIQARHFRSLKSVDQRLSSVHALVGPNASGKTTFLDVLGLVSDLIRNRGDVQETFAARSPSFEKLVWQGRDSSGLTPEVFQLAVEAPIPSMVQSQMMESNRRYNLVRYELEFGIDAKTNELGLNHETLWLSNDGDNVLPVQREFFPDSPSDASSIISPKSRPNSTSAIKKTPGGNDNYYPEGAKSYRPSFKLGRTKSALANIPADESNFPVSLWFKNMLEQGVKSLVLNSQKIRHPSRPGQGLNFQTDGSNLPWVVAELQRNSKRFDSWIAHVRTALPDVQSISWVERPEDLHRYLVVNYSNGAAVPSWLVSDGTLRLLALTIPAYLTDFSGVFLIEEPENGIHPRAIETVLQSLSSIYDGQVLIATHSPVAINMLEASQVLCFAKDADGATDIVAGNLHPALRDWKRGQPDLGLLFASGILS